jgi:CMP-N-acetylneuraminic acid synthetase
MSPARVVAFVHAKGQSDRVPSKNLRTLGDRPLFCHAIRNALAAELVDHVVIDSDSDEILELGERYGAEPLKRPPELASNATSGDDLAYWQASNQPDSAIVLQVIPTAPFLKPHSIDRAVAMLRTGEADSVAGVFSDVFYTWKAGRPAYYRTDGTLPNSSELAPTVFETTGLYANLTATVLRTRKRMNPDRVAPLFLSRLEAIDINTPEDFAFAELVARGLELDRGQPR